jgi:hypothetical protein
LYGNIPLENDTQNNVRGLITIVTDFFVIHRQASLFPDLEPRDFLHLLRMVLYDDTYLFEGALRTQSKGIAMGNCAAPPLAIIYMDYVEREIIAQCPGINLWKRYIDDVFFITKSSPEELLAIANRINTHIQFTLEKPANNQIPFLDTLVHVDECGNVTFGLFIKPTHSGTCLPFDSYVPLSRKKCLIVSETIRTERIASSNHLATSQKKIANRFQCNGYPKKVLENTIRRVVTTPKDKPEYVSFVKVPFVADSQRNRVVQLYKRTGMRDKIRLIFATERPLAWHFRPNHETPACPAGCIACTTAEVPNSCFTKKAVYKVTCALCNATYIGQTDRTMRSRIIEHSKDNFSHVHLHMESHSASNPNWNKQFKWRVLATHPYTTTRLAIEALFIKKQGSLMNGCEGSRLLPFIY